MEGREKPKQAFRIIRVAKYEFSGGYEIQRICTPKEVQKTNRINRFGSIGAYFLRFRSVSEKGDLFGPPSASTRHSMVQGAVALDTAAWMESKRKTGEEMG